MHMNSNPHPCHATLLLVQMTLCAVAVVSQLYIPIPIMARLAEDYGLPPELLELSLIAFSLCYATGFLVFGPLSDRFGRRLVLALGLVALSIVSIAMSVVSSPEPFIAMRALQGFVAASFPPVAIAYLSERGHARQRAWGVAWLSTGFLIAGLLGQLYGGVVAGAWGFGKAMIPLIAIYLITAAMILAAPKGGQGEGALMPLLAIYRPVFRLLADPLLRRVYVPALLLLMTFVAFYVGLDSRLHESQGSALDPLAARAIALPGLFAPLAVAAVIQRWGAQRVASSGLAVAALGLFLVAMSGDQGLLWLLAASVIFVAGVGISVPGLIAFTSTRAPASARGLAVALYTFVLFLGASLGPWIARLGGAWGNTTLFLVLAACLAAVAAYSATGKGHAAR